MNIAPDGDARAVRLTVRLPAFKFANCIVAGPAMAVDWGVALSLPLFPNADRRGRKKTELDHLAKLIGVEEIAQSAGN